MKSYRLTILIIGAALVFGLYLFLQHSEGNSRNANAQQSLNPVTARTGFSGSQNPMLTRTNLSKFVRGILENWSQLPDLSKIGQLTAEDKRVLVEAYRREPVLVKRRSLTFALGFGEVEEAVELFKHTLTDEFKNQRINSGYDNETDAQRLMFSTLEMLGLLACKHDSALVFLKQGVDPLFWKEKALWTSDLGSGQYGILAGDSIVSICMSGRAEIPQFLEGLRSEPLVNTADASEFRRVLDGAVVEAAFWYDLVTQKEYTYMKTIYGTEAKSANFHEWLQTENGKKWDQWYEERFARRAKK